MAICQNAACKHFPICRWPLYVSVLVMPLQLPLAVCPSTAVNEVFLIPPESFLLPHCHVHGCLTQSFQRCTAKVQVDPPLSHIGLCVVKVSRFRIALLQFKSATGCLLKFMATRLIATLLALSLIEESIHVHRD